ncbi:MAG: Trp family transcriptional regulator [bacterium]|nr:Trp family transcriptional regulator [bacterium]
MSKPKTNSAVNIPDHLIRELLTPSELRMLQNRWKIMNLLEEGLTIRGIAEEVKVGTDTVVRVARMTERKTVREALNKNLNSKRTIKSKTPWIFGKSE